MLQNWFHIKSEWQKNPELFTLWLCSMSHSVEKREIHCHAIFFSSNQLRVKFFSKKLISRNFCEKMVTAKFRNFQGFFSQKFRQITILVKKFTINWFDGKKFAWQWISRLSTRCVFAPQSRNFCDFTWNHRFHGSS